MDNKKVGEQLERTIGIKFFKAFGTDGESLLAYVKYALKIQGYEVRKIKK